MAHTNAYTIGTAARLTGVPPWKLRAWESAGLLKPARSPSGYRIYQRADLEVIARISDAVGRGGRLAAHALGAGAAEERAAEGQAPDGASSGEAYGRAAEILALAQRLADAQWCGLLWPVRGRLEIVAAAGPATGTPQPRPLSPHEEIEWTRVLLHEHVSVQIPGLGPFAAGELTALSVRAGGVRGAVVIAHARRDIPTEVSRLAAVAVGRDVELGRERERHGRRRQQLQVARTFGTALASHAELDELLENALDAFVDFTHFDAGLVALTDRAGRRLVAVTARGLSPHFLAGVRDFRTDEGIAGRAFAARKPMIVRDLRTDPRVTRDPVRAEGLRTYLSIPLVHRDRSVGLVELGSRRPDMTDPEDVDFLLLLTEILAAAVVNRQLTEKLDTERHERSSLVRSWGDDVAAARAAAHAAIARRLEHLDADEAVPSHAVQALLRELAEHDTSDFDPREIIDRAVATEPATGTALRVGIAGRWSDIPRLGLTGDAGAVIRELVRVAIRNDAVELELRLSEAAEAPSIECREVRREAVSAVAHPVLPHRLAVTVHEDDPLVTTTVVSLAREPAGAADLTRREVEVLQLFAESHTTREVAALLGISSKTLANGLTATYAKLGVSTRTQAVTEAIRRGIVRVPV